MAAWQTGKTLINVNDIIGQVHGSMEVVKYLNKREVRTSGGIKIRHDYECRCRLCGMTYICERSNIRGLTGYAHKCIMSQCQKRSDGGKHHGMGSRSRGVPIMGRGRKLGQTMINPEDVIGQVHGTMEVVKYLGKEIHMINGQRVTRHFYECRCKLCGKTYRVRRGGIEKLTGYRHKCIQYWYPDRAEEIAAQAKEK